VSARPKFVAAVALACAPAALAQVLSQSTIASVGGANALSTPAARHLVRMDSGTYLLALQRDAADSQAGLTLWRSDDDAQTWSWYASLNSRASDRHTADVIRVGADLAIVQSFDAPSIFPDAALDPARKVYFQWWRSNGRGDWLPDPRVTVFSPPSGSAYHRGEIALDSAGRIWVQAFRRTATSCDPASDRRCAACEEVVNGDNYQNEIVVSASEDGGKTFSAPRSLGTTLCRAGGRLISVGTKLLLLWNDYSANENASRITTRFVVRDARDPRDCWSAPRDAFPDDPADGIYHGAALSAVADEDSLHLVYKDQNRMRLWYRRFDAATATFGAAVAVDDSVDDWALQPATTLRGGELYVIANHRLSEGSYQTRMWALSTGLGAQAALPIASDDAFHAYPTLPETLPRSTQTLPYVYARAAGATSPGDEVTVRIGLDRPAATLSLDTRAILPAGKSIAIRVQTLKVPGVAGPVALDLAGVPAGVTARFESAQVMPGDVTSLTLSADPSAAATSSRCVLGMTANGQRATKEFRLDVYSAPAVELRGPQPGAVLAGVAQVEVTGTASPGLSLSEVRLLVDGAPLATSSTSPAAFPLDTAAIANGPHDLSALAVDEIGNSSSTPPLRIEVQNRGAHGGGCASAAATHPLLLLAVLAALCRKRRLN